MPETRNCSCLLVLFGRVPLNLRLRQSSGCGSNERSEASSVTGPYGASSVSLLSFGVSGWDVGTGGSFPYLPDKDGCDALAEEAAGHVDRARS